MGSLIEALIIALSGWESLSFYMIVTVMCMCAGGIVGVYNADKVKKYLTALIGAYLFMRGWTYFFGGFPSELSMYDAMASQNSEELDFNNMFWMYIGIFIGAAILFVYV